MNPLIDEMLVRQRYEELLRKSARQRWINEILRSRQGQKRTLRAYVLQLATLLNQRLRAQLKLS